jgi:hypothetical protein
MEIRQLDGYPHSGRWYYGNAGRKDALLIDDAPWLVKFHHSSDSKGGEDNRRASSYTNSPLGEYLGSHIYSSLGIPAQETLLGIREGRLVVACKDFRQAHQELIEFKAIAIQYPGAEHQQGDMGSGNGSVLSEVLDTINNAYPLNKAEAVLERFWDMFVTDYFIGNNDRNNTNWGLIKTGQNYQLAPVYDNGRAFTDRLMLGYLTADELTSATVQRGYQCNFTDGQRYIQPYQLLLEGTHSGAADAANRLINRVDMAGILDFIDKVPTSFQGIEILCDKDRAMFKAVLETRLNECIIPALSASK